MLVKKLTEILKTFDKDELKKFKRFISSDYFNTNETVVKLYKLITAFYPEFNPNEKKLTPEALFKSLYGQRKYDEQTFRYLISALHSLAEEFLAHTTFANSRLEVRKSVIHNLIARRLHNHALKNLKAAEAELENQSHLSSDYVFHKMDYGLLWHQLYFISGLQEPLLDKRLEHGEYFIYNTVAELSHIFQIIYKISNSFNFNVRENLVYELFKSIDGKSMILNIEKNEDSELLSSELKKIYKTLKIYLCFMETMKDTKDEIYFEHMHRLLNEYSELFDKKEQQNLYLMFATVCNTKRKNLNDEKYQRKYFEIVKSGVAKDLYISQRYMDIPHFITILKTALEQNEINWAEQFQKKYIVHVHPEYMQDISHYSESELLFSKGIYTDSLRSLSKVKTGHFRLKLPVKILTLKLYFELGNFEKAFLLIDSFTKFLASNKNLHEDEKVHNSAFLKYYKELLIAKVDEAKPGKDLLNEIESASLLPHKNWLTEKARQFK